MGCWLLGLHWQEQEQEHHQLVEEVCLVHRLLDQVRQQHRLVEVQVVQEIHHCQEQHQGQQGQEHASLEQQFAC
jgi:hypothetical protein